MKRLSISLVFTVLFAPGVIAGQKDAPTAQEIGSKTLRSLLPKMLDSSDEKLVHEALLIILSDFVRDRQPSDALHCKVIGILQRLLKDPKDSEAGTRRVACEILGRAKSRKAIPVLLKALADPHIDWDFFAPDPGDAAEVNWFAVWRDADYALREITGADPVPQPGGRQPQPGQREATRRAWEKWYRDNSEQKNSPDKK